MSKQDPVSIMQKTGLNNFSSCLDWSTTVDVITMGHSRNIFPCIRPFSAWRQPNNQPTEQRGDPRASMPLISEKAVFCKNCKIGREGHPFSSRLGCPHVWDRLPKACKYAALRHFPHTQSCGLNLSSKSDVSHNFPLFMKLASNTVALIVLLSLCYINDQN